MHIRINTDATTYLVIDASLAERLDIGAGSTISIDFSRDRITLDNTGSDYDVRRIDKSCSVQVYFSRSKGIELAELFDVDVGTVLLNSDGSVLEVDCRRKRTEVEAQLKSTESAVLTKCSDLEISRYGLRDALYVLNTIAREMNAELFIENGIVRARITEVL